MAAQHDGAGRAGEQLLVVEDLRTTFHVPGGLLDAVDGVSFSLAAGEALGIVGESGSGKSVLVRSIMGLLPSQNVAGSEGTVIFDGQDVRTLAGAARKHFWGAQVAMVFQNPMSALNPVRTIGAQLTDPLRVHLGMRRKAARERAVELLTEVGITEPRRRLDQYPHELSGGMRQRVLIATAISCEPRLLIVDEPTTALDVVVQKQILDLLARLQEEHHMAMILISHDLGVVRDYTDRVAVMYAGQLVETATTDGLFEAVRHPYTDALLRSIPPVDQPSHTRLQTIEGRPPVVIRPRVGCSFAPRCKRATERCHAEVPELSGEGHRYRCFFPLPADGTGGAAAPGGTTVLSGVDR